MKKILFMGGLTSGGAEHQMVIIASALSRRGYDVSYLYADDTEFFKPLLVDAGLKIIKINESKLSSLLKLNIPRLTCKVYNILKTGHYDTVVSFLGMWNFENCLFAKCRKTKHKAITGLRNSRDSVLLSKREKFYTKYEKYAELKVCNSENAKRIFAQYFPEHKDKLITIYNAVSSPTITSTYSIQQNNKTNIIIPASYRDVKNPFGLLEALKLLDDESKAKLHITWYGNISAGKAVYDKMLEQITTNDLAGIIELKDATTDIVNRINESDIVGLFSKSEGLPNAICEGMLLGKPIIMTRVSDYDVLVDESNGVLCDWDKPKTIAEALQKIANVSDNELVKMGESSKGKAKKLFSEEYIIKQWENVI